MRIAAPTAMAWRVRTVAGSAPAPRAAVLPAGLAAARARRPPGGLLVVVLEEGQEGRSWVAFGVMTVIVCDGGIAYPGCDAPLRPDAVVFAVQAEGPARACRMPRL